MNIMNDVKLQLKCYAERLETYMIAKVAQMQSSTTMELDTLYDAMRHSLSAGGKRIRPVLIYEFCKIKRFAYICDIKSVYTIF